MPFNKQFKIPRRIIGAMLVLFISQLTFSQGIREEDKLDASSAKERKDNFHNMFSGKKNLTRSVTFNVDELQEIINLYKAANVTEIPFVFAVIRTQDSDRYASKHHLKDDDKKSIVNQPTLLIKGPPNGSASLKKMTFSNYYFDIGTICPPPGSCLE